MKDADKEIFRLAEAIYPEMVAFRHSLHRQPELGYAEHKTVAKILAVLEKWKIETERVSGSTAVIAYIRGELPGEKSIALRAEIDALPIQEQSGVAFSSAVPGVMHACGHDFNTANLLGTAYILNSLKGGFSGTIKLLFQPAEEIFGGAQELLDYGVLRNPAVSAILAAHVSSRYPVGKIAVKEGFINMAASSFAVILRGPGGHAAAPHRSVDLILVAAKLIEAMQLLPGHKVNHIDPGILVVSHIEGGSAGNVLPEEVRFSGTIRAQERAVHELYAAEIRKLLRVQRFLNGIEGTLEFSFKGEAVYNDLTLTQFFCEEAALLLGEAQVIRIAKPTNGSENFALFSAKVPSVYFHIGGKGRNDREVSAVHSPTFRVEDAGLSTGMRVLAKAALAVLQR